MYKEQTRKVLTAVYVTEITDDTGVLWKCDIFVTEEIESSSPPPTKCLYNVFFQSNKVDIS